jgi:hypothetical protein
VERAAEIQIPQRLELTAGTLAACVVAAAVLATWLPLQVSIVTVSLWTRLRRFCLQVGLYSAFLLTACELSVTTADWSPVLAGVAASCVGLWTAGAPLWLLTRRAGLERPIASV